MHRITMTIDDELLETLDRVMAERGYQNRSEAIRDLARAGIAQSAPAQDSARESVAALVYVYDHEGRDLSKRLTRSFHDHHDLSLATLHVHLDHESCMEVAVLRGPMREVRHFADHVMAERGVQHGQLVSVPVEFHTQKHAHGGEPTRPPSPCPRARGRLIDAPSSGDCGGARGAGALAVAHAQSRAEAPLEEVVVVGPTPLAGVGIDRDKVPASVTTLVRDPISRATARPASLARCRARSAASASTGRSPIRFNRTSSTAASRPRRCWARRKGSPFIRTASGSTRRSATR